MAGLLQDDGGHGSDSDEETLKYLNSLLDGEGCDSKCQLTTSFSQISVEHLKKYQAAQSTTITKMLPTTSSPLLKNAFECKQENIRTDPYSGLRMRNPLITEEEMKNKMTGRKMVKLSKIGSQFASYKMETNWVTIGVLVEKLPPKESSKGKMYSIWRLSDLSSLSIVLTLFLFGDAHKEHWTMPLGYIIAILNPDLSTTEKQEQKSGIPYSASINHPNKLMQLGISEDYTVCKAIVKSTGKRCHNFASLSEGGCCDYHVHGVYKSIKANRGEFQAGYGPSHGNGLSKLTMQMKKERVFYQGQSLPGAFLSNGKGSSTGQAKRISMPVATKTVAKSTKDLVKNRKDKAVPSRGIVISEASEDFKQYFQLNCAGARNLVNHFKKNERKGFDLTPEVSANKVLKYQESMMKVNSPTPSRCVQQRQLPSPKLAGGLTGADIDLSEEKKPSNSKAKILHQVQKIGQIKNERKSEKKIELIRKRALEGSALGKFNSKSADISEGISSKKTKFNPDEKDMQAIINAKSSHDWEVTEDEWKREQEYFKHSERKEALEEKLNSITEIKVLVVQCFQCNYVAEHVSSLCIKENHKVRRFRTVKRFFQCSDCDHKVSVLNKILPINPCTNCGSSNFKKCGMGKISKGPKLDSENLLIRGIEEKFLH